MKIVWSDLARKDLRAIKDYIARDSEFYANQMIGAIIFRVGSVGEHPSKGHKVHEFPEMPLKEIHEKPYRIIYRCTRSQLEVVTIVHFRKLLRIR